MYCPKCGDLMKEEENTFVCVRGRMQTSVELARRLREYAATGESSCRQRRTVPTPGLQGLAWFCPCCAVVLQGDYETGFGCEKCGRKLGKGVIYHLIEHHPHWTGAGDAWC